MTRLEELAAGATVSGIVPNVDVTVVASTWHGQGAVTLTYREASGRVGERLLYRADEPSLSLRSDGRTWTFDADGASFRLAAEARRIRLAHLFDPMLAVHLSRMEPLPHQIRGVYGDMLPRQPLRFLLADDPGAGKTIMSGLLIKELMLRGDLARCLVVVPGGLVDQWQDELREKFDLDFKILTRERVEASYTANPFAEESVLIVRMDQLSRSEELQSKLEATEWDLVVVDEAHKMSAHFEGDEVRETKRYRLGRLLGRIARHFLLLTATPHSGNPDDFQLFLALLDPDRFEGRRSGPVDDTSDLWRRMIKEKLLRFDGRRLFPERRATTVEFPLSEGETELYERVTDYVRNEMDRADRLAGNQRAVVGFALTGLQRRLASSPEAILRSLVRRRERLERRLTHPEEPSETGSSEAVRRLEQLVEDDDLPDLVEAEGDRAEDIDEAVVDEASAAVTRTELRAEITALTELERLAALVRRSGTDTKWVELRGLLDQLLASDSTQRKKLIVFTEHRDTLTYLFERLVGYFGRAEAVVAIHGGVHREERRRLQDEFRQDPDVVVMVATDAAGEGVNLQQAHLLVNYDLPWNPNRIEQRFGRIHRIGQEEVCHLWNLVAKDTREGHVYSVLLRKLEEEQAALGGQVFDVLGRALSGQRLRDLLVQAIRYGESPDVRARLDEVIDSSVGEGLARLIDEEALSADVMGLADVEAIRAQMELAAARRLQPHYVRAFFLAALERLGGRALEREPGRYELTFVPAEVRNRPGHGALLRRYERVTFDKELISVVDRPSAEFLCPGDPLLDTVVDIVAVHDGGALLRGTVLVDDYDAGATSHVLLMLEHAITDGRGAPSTNGRVVSRRFEFVAVDPDGKTTPAGPAPYLDCRAASTEELRLIAAHVDRSWLSNSTDQAALDYAIEALVPEHLAEVRGQIETRIDKVTGAVHARLTAAINYWDRRATELAEQAKSGRQPRMNPDRARARADELADRLQRRMTELAQERQLQALPPVVVGAALIVPGGLLRHVSGADETELQKARMTAEVERRAVEAVLAAERHLGRNAREMPHANPGYDIQSEDADRHLHFIEVKGRVAGAETVIVTRTEILTGLNVTDSYILALVEVGPDDDEQVRYLRNPFSGKSDRLHFAETSTVFDWAKLWAIAGAPN